MIPAKCFNDVIITYNLKYLVGNQLSNLNPIIASLYAIIHQLLTTTTRYTSIIVVRKPTLL